MKNNFSGADHEGVAKFYKDTNRFKAREYEEWLSKKFIDHNDRIKSEWVFEHTECPVCNSDLSYSRILFKKSGYIHWRCENCESLYTNPSLNNEAILTEVYGHTAYPFLDIVNSKNQINFDKNKFKEALETIINDGLVPQNSSVFDFGCGSGVFLHLCKEYGFKDQFGNDVLKEAVKFARNNYNLQNVLCEDATRDLNRLNSEIKIIALWELLDHLNEPTKLLNELISKISRGCYIIISVRNADSLAAKILRDKCNMFLGHAHFNFWSNKAINNLINNNTFTTVDYYQYISERDVICNYVNYQEPYASAANELDWLPSKEEILNKRLGYKHVLILKKK